MFTGGSGLKSPAIEEAQKMPEWFSFAVLALGGSGMAVCADRFGRSPRTITLNMICALGSFGLMGLSLAASPDCTVIPLCLWLRETLPGSGTPINQLEAFSLTGVGCVLFVLGVPLAIGLALFWRTDASVASRMATRTIARARASARREYSARSRNQWSIKSETRMR
jgi:hypothetical protein